MARVPRLPSPALCSTFETESKDVWLHLEAAFQVGLSRGEATITDDLLLNVQKAHPSEVFTYPFDTRQEGIVGADWEWWLSNGRKWVGLLIQAKKLNPKSNKYGKIKYKNQMDQLIRWARQKHVSPLYVFYNYSKLPSRKLAWNCGSMPFVKEQLGCTVAHALAVRTVVKSGGAGLSRMTKISLPMRCLVCCPVLGGPNGSLPERVHGVANYLGNMAGGIELSPRSIEPGALREDPPDYVRRLLSTPEEDRRTVIEQLRDEVGPIAGLVVVNSVEDD